MKLINYNYGYYPKFTASMHGKIVMTDDEWQKARTYLLKGSKRWLPSYPWVSKTLKEDAKRSIPTRNGSYLINIRVPATEALVKKYNLKKYKRANYLIEVVLL